MSSSASGTTICEPLARGEQILELSAPGEPVAGGHFDSLSMRLCASATKRAEIAAAHVGGGTTTRRLPFSRLIWFESRLDIELGDFAERNEARACRRL